MKTKKIQKILLVFPPTIMSNIGNFRAAIPPLGLIQLAAVCRENKYEVEILDTIVEGHQYLKPIDKKYNRYGLPIDEIIKKIKDYKPDMVGISCLFSSQIDSTLEICSYIKTTDDSIITIIGGTHPTFMANSLLQKNNTIDYIVLGEGENTLIKLIQHLNEGRNIEELEGIAFKNGEKLYYNKLDSHIHNLDSLPFPAYDLLPMEKYFTINITHDLTKGSKRSINIMTSRGCPGKCVFCSSSKYWGTKFRAKSSKRVLDEIEYVIEKYKVNHIEFTDDTFTLDKKRLKEILNGIIEKNYKITWSCPNGVSVYTLNEEVISLMKKSGCSNVTLAVESGNQELLDGYLNKNVNLQQVLKVSKMLKKADINYSAFYIVGFPPETKQQINNTFKFASKVNALFSYFFLANPIPGSDLYHDVEKKNYLNPDFDFRYLDLGRSCYRTDHFTSIELEKYYYKKYSGFLIKSSLKSPFKFLPYLVGDSEIAFQAFKVIKQGIKCN